ncbi:MAG: tRNA (guanosine(18)-2'-O)-methyltransferase TrmH [Gammaproteobacteria bacterium]|jgi:tRNA (guanosine-2'-O-)-methyltransferase
MTPSRFARLKRVLSARQPDLTVLMDAVHKSHNIAAILRTCDATGVFRAHAVDPDGDVSRNHMAAGGTGRYVGLRIHDTVHEACDALKTRGFSILAAHFSESAVDYREFDYTRPTAFLLGAELDGVSPQAAELSDGHVVIPMEGLVASLNVSVAAALLLYEARRQREAAGLYRQSRLEPELFSRTLFEWAHPDIAQRCRDQGLPYPALTDDGDLAGNPFAS